MTENFYASIGARIKELREKANMSQGQVAERAGVHQTELSAFETRGAKIRGAGKINKILDAIGYQVEVTQKKTTSICV